MRLIDADKLKKAFCSHCDGDEPCTEPCIDIGLIETAPTIDAVEVVRGKWKIDEYGIYHCPICHAINNTVYKSFCPNCGMRSDGKEQNDD